MDLALAGPGGTGIPHLLVALGLSAQRLVNPFLPGFGAPSPARPLLFWGVTEPCEDAPRRCVPTAPLPAGTMARVWDAMPSVAERPSARDASTIRSPAPCCVAAGRCRSS